VTGGPLVFEIRKPTGGPLVTSESFFMVIIRSIVADGRPNR